MDEGNPAPPKKPWKDDSPVNTNNQWFPIDSKWCRILSIHSIECVFVWLLAGKPIGSRPFWPASRWLLTSPVDQVGS